MSDKQSIQPRLVKGFRDILPKVAAQREWAISQLQDIFRSYGYQ